MAKKENSDEPKLEGKDFFLNSMKTKYGDVFKTAEEILSEPRYTIPVSPVIDYILYGGIPEGSWCVFTGEEKTGKTTLTLHFAANCQMPEHGNRDVYYLDIEGRLSEKNLLGIPKLNRKKFYPICSTKENHLTAEQFLNAATDILLQNEKCLVIIDSYSMLCGDAEHSEEIGKANIAIGPRLLSQFFKKNATVLAARKNIVIGITHLMANIGTMGGRGPKKAEASGTKAKYQCDVKLRSLKAVDWEGIKEKTEETDGQEGWKEVKRGQVIGQATLWDCEWSAKGPPGVRLWSYHRFGAGIDETYEAMKIGKDLGLIRSSGSWRSLDYLQSHLNGLWDESQCKAQGDIKLYNLLMENPSWIEILKKEISTCLNGV